MARLVPISRDGPYEITPQPRSVWACGCGLSKNLPLCDGSHVQARAESKDTIQVYDTARRKVVTRLVPCKDATCPHVNCTMTIDPKSCEDHQAR
jgi:CDGSH-type Zn-finger protein